VADLRLELQALKEKINRLDTDIDRVVEGVNPVITQVNNMSQGVQIVSNLVVNPVTPVVINTQTTVNQVLAFLEQQFPHQGHNVLPTLLRAVAPVPP
jgi:uncharacterized protein YoxC